MSRWLGSWVVVAICIVAMGAWSNIFADTYGCENNHGYAYPLTPAMDVISLAYGTT